MDRRALIAGALALSASPLAARAAEDLARDAADAWLWVLPLIEMAQARTRMLSTGGGQGASLNAFRHARRLVGPADRAITTPNNDTLYSSALLDLTGGPLELEVPEPGRRYVSVAVMDMYTNNNVVLGARTPGGMAGRWRLLPPGTAPSGPRDLVLATPHAWALGRTLVDGPEDLEAAHRVQDGIRLSGPGGAPPGSYARRSDPAPLYFASAERLLRSDPPRWTAGRDAFERLRAAFPGGRFDAPPPPETARRIEAACAAVRRIIEGAGARPKFEGGWNYPQKDLGDYGEDFRYRAAVAVNGLGALPVAEAMYMRASAPDGAAVFTGEGAYRLRMPARAPVDGFWSLTMYEATPEGQFYLTENSLGRYAIGDRTRGLKRLPSGEIEILIGRSDPGEALRSNWLPAPRSGPFALTLRCYLPRPELLSGAYRFTAVEPA